MIKLDVVNNVGSLDAIVSDDTRSSQSCSTLGLEFAQALFVSIVLGVHYVVVNIIDEVEYGFCGHKSSTVIKNKRATILVLVGHCFESTPNLHVHITDINRF